MSWIKNSTAWKTRWPGGNDKNTSTETALPSKSYENSKNCERIQKVQKLLFLFAEYLYCASTIRRRLIPRCFCPFYDRDRQMSDKFWPFRWENMAAFSLFPLAILSPIFTMRDLKLSNPLKLLYIVLLLYCDMKMESWFLRPLPRDVILRDMHKRSAYTFYHSRGRKTLRFNSSFYDKDFTILSQFFDF